MTNLTPEDPEGTGASADAQPGNEPAAGSDPEARAQGSESGDSPEPGQDGQDLDEDRRQYPEQRGEVHGAPATPVIVRPSSRQGYQTVTINPDRAKDASQQAKREARRKRRRRRNIALVSAFGVFVLLVVGLSLGVRGLLPSPAAKDYPGPGGEEVVFTVNQGEGALAIGTRLEDQDIVASREAFIEAVNQSRSENSIQPGDYPLRSQMKASDAAAILQREGVGQVHYVAINRGMRLNEAFEAISTSTGIPVEDLEAAAEDPTDFGLPETAPSLEGYLAPGEYRFDIEAEPAEILTLLTEPTFATLEADGVTDEAEQLRTLTIASILEAEALPKDYATVAGIIENRLHPDNPETDGRLQIDATVIYGLGQRQLQFTQEEKEDASNEYNTYAHRGLPPGPIGAPSTEAIDAASSPEDNEFYYWVTTNIETGETKFARDYATHRTYQQEYRDYCAENKEICG
ncbi:endolytic transglycosylase MltG [Citricoccus zhacaiensis]|uniref:endolytic transglycosylase MltG n=1 Tax=Citricoccus zhacaiensis TaxID=489142 RepID=UPI003CEFBAFC